jgi:hypothetical protein
MATRPTVTKFIVQTRYVGREICDDDWETLEPRIIEAWREYDTYFTDLPVNVRGEVCEVSLNFRPAVEALREHHEILEATFYHRDPSGWEDFDRDFIRIRAKIRSKASKDLLRPEMDESELQYLLIETFLVMNISLPGSCDFGDAYITSSPPRLSMVGTEIRY